MEKRTKKEEKEKGGKYLRRRILLFHSSRVSCCPVMWKKIKISAKVEHWNILFIDIPKVVDKKVQETTKTIDVKQDIL